MGRIQTSKYNMHTGREAVFPRYRCVLLLFLFFNVMDFECMMGQDKRAGSHENESLDSICLVFWLQNIVANIVNSGEGRDCN